MNLHPFGDLENISQMLAPQSLVTHYASSSTFPCLPSRPPTLADWNHFQSIIVQRYLTDDQTLSEVRNYMASKYRFIATYVPFQQSADFY